MRNDRRLPVFLDEDLQQWTRLRAAVLGMSMSEYVRRLLEDERRRSPDPLRPEGRNLANSDNS